MGILATALGGPRVLKKAVLCLSIAVRCQTTPEEVIQNCTEWIHSVTREIGNPNLPLQTLQVRDWQLEDVINSLPCLLPLRKFVNRKEARLITAVADEWEMWQSHNEVPGRGDLRKQAYKIFLWISYAESYLAGMRRDTDPLSDALFGLRDRLLAEIRVELLVQDSVVAFSQHEAWRSPSLSATIQAHLNKLETFELTDSEQLNLEKTAEVLESVSNGNVTDYDMYRLQAYFGKLLASIHLRFYGVNPFEQDHKEQFTKLERLADEAEQHLKN